MKGRSRRRFAGLEDVVRLRTLGAIETLCARDGASGEPRIVVAATNSKDRRALELIEKIAGAHARLDHPWIPKVAEVRPGCVLFRASATTDLHSVEEAARTSGFRVQTSAAVAFTIECLRMLQSAHARGVYMGAFAWANVLVSADGHLHCLGFGHPHEAAARAALLQLVGPSFVAPEVALGASPMPGSDLTAATLFFHSFVHLGEPRPEVVAALRGEATPGHERLPDLVTELMKNSHAARPEDRSIARFLETFDAVIADLGVAPSAEDLSEDLVRLVSAVRVPTLTVGEEARWFRVDDGERVDLARRGPLRRVLMCLVDAGGAPVGWEDVLSSGWPGENPDPESGRNRVYVALAELRSLGLRDVLVRGDDGYRIGSSVRVRREAG
jgi:hypothetical protein